MKLAVMGMALAALLLSGCAENQQPESAEPAAAAETPPPATASTSLAGLKFDVVSIRDKEAIPGQGKKPMLTFMDDMRVGFTGGCNQMSGSYVYQAPEDIKLGDENGFVGTRMACAQELMDQDQSLSDALQQAAKILSATDGKRLVDAAGTELVVLRTAPPE
jgi:heat shock protein HslJ